MKEGITSQIAAMENQQVRGFCERLWTDGSYDALTEELLRDTGPGGSLKHEKLVNEIFIYQANFV
jgi:hypothetical protein